MYEIFVIIEPYVALTAILINLVFAVLVMARTSRSALYNIFLFICIFVIFWNLAEFVRLSTGKQQWSYISLIASAVIPTLMFHFIITLVKPEQNNTFWIVPAYIFSCLLALAASFALFRQEMRRFVDDSYWDISYFTLFVPFFWGGVVMLIDALKRAPSRDEKSRLRYILAADIIGVIIVTTDHLQTLKIFLPPLGHLGSVVYPSILAVGVFKHRSEYDILAQTKLKLEALSEMAASLAHEIRNPLSSIKGASRLLSNELKNFTDMKTCEYVDIIADEAKRLNTILLNFQCLTKPIKIEKEEISINDVIERTVKLVEAEKLHVKIALELCEGLQKIAVDPSSLRQVFLNLIKNASEACRSEGQLTIKTEHVPPWVKISFTDNGPGIADEMIDRVFEPFFTTKPAGMGVGLAISKRIIDAHSGKIEVGNVSPTGAQFSVFLPAHG